MIFRVTSYRANAHIHTEPPNCSNASRTQPGIEAAGTNGVSVVLDFIIHSVQASGTFSLGVVFDKVEKGKHDEYLALSLVSGAKIVPLVMEANGGRFFTAQPCLNMAILRYTMRKGVTAAAAKTYWRLAFLLSRS